MLDDITNKNIWMIGAVIVGIALIAAVKAGFTEVMNSVINWMKGLVSSNTQSTDGKALSGGSTILMSVDWGSIASHAGTILTMIH